MKVRQTLIVDRANLKILEVLQKNGKVSFERLSAMVGLSPSPCFFRVKKMQKAGIIRSYGAHIDLEKFGPHVILMTEITLEKHTLEYDKLFRKYIKGVPEVVAAYMVSGKFDYLLHFVCRDIDRYMTLSTGMADADLGITNLTSYVILNTVKEFDGFPLTELGSHD